MVTTAKKIAFVIDDEKVIAGTLALILKQNDYDAKPFYSGESAMQEGGASPPQLLISDVAMQIERAVVDSQMESYFSIEL
jgi:FixJ family two-component response regulator